MCSSDLIKSKCDTALVCRRRRGNADINARDPSQRYSVEVTSAAMLLKGNPDLNLEPLFASHKSQPQKQDQSQSATSDKVKAMTCSDDSEEFPIVVALQKIWNYIKRTCTESTLREASENSLDNLTKKNPKFKKERKVSRGVTDQNLRPRKERPKELQSVGRSFLLGKFVSIFKINIIAHVVQLSVLKTEPEGNNEFLDEMQRCEVCQCRFSTNGKSR